MRTTSGKQVFRIRIGFNADPDLTFYLKADPDPNLDPGKPNLHGIRIRILVILCHHKKLDFDPKNIGYIAYNVGDGMS